MRYVLAALGVSAAGAVAALGTTSSAPVGDPDPLDRQALVAVCGACHPVNLVEDSIRSAPDWHDTVQTMVDRGADGSDEQFTRIMRYLRLSLTSINVNDAAPAELRDVLGVDAAAAQAIVTRRRSRHFAGLADLLTVRGLNGAAILARKARIAF